MISASQSSELALNLFFRLVVLLLCLLARPPNSLRHLPSTSSARAGSQPRGPLHRAPAARRAPFPRPRLPRIPRLSCAATATWSPSSPRAAPSPLRPFPHPSLPRRKHATSTSYLAHSHYPPASPLHYWYWRWRSARTCIFFFCSVHVSSEMELHYINTGFPYTVTESFMDFFEGLTYAHADFALTDGFQDQGNPYWAMMHTNSYKYGYSAPGNYYSYAHVYDIDDYMHRADGERRIWDNTTPVNNVDSANVVLQGGEAPRTTANSTTEECIPQVHQSPGSPQVVWQDNIDPDNMTYEELLDLGEAVGTQSRGLSQERISLLPVTKYKCGFFSRKKTRRERCVICQMEYRRGNLQMTLPCKHVYHASCVTRWLSINKVCPVCFAEVPGEEPKRP